MLARAQQDAVWERQQAQAKLRSLLREYYPAFLAAFPDLADRDARAALAIAPSPAAAARLRRPSLRAALARNGRQRNLDHQVERILTELRVEHMRQPARVEAAMSAQALAHLRSLDAAVANAAALEASTAAEFATHDDAAIITSMPGLGPVLAARVLAELGDDHSRFADAKSLKAFAGTAPVTRASGLKRSVTRRVVRNKRLGQAGHLWHSACSPAAPAPARTTTDDARPATATTLPRETSPTATSACCTTVCRTACPTTKPKPTPRPEPSQHDLSTAPLDTCSRGMSGAPS